MKVFFDTNVLIAAFISHGACKELFEHCIDTHTPCISGFILREFESKLINKFKFQKKLVREVLSYLKNNLTVLKDAKLAKPVCRDHDDDAVLAAAHKGGVACIVTGDGDLLILVEYEGIPIVKPADFWKLEKKRSKKI